jgi:hypothetical protein
MSAQPPSNPPAQGAAPTPPPGPENQGIPYTLRRIQMIDAVILSAIIAVFAITYEVRDEVRDMRAEREAEEKVEAENPPIRREQFAYTVKAIWDQLKVVSDRVTELEDDAEAE